MDADLPAGAVARRLGVAVTTLRTWHQRYGLGPTGHTAGLHRRYTDADLVRLETMRRLTARGVPAAEAAAHALAGTAGPPAPSTRDGGGATIAVGRARAEARGLARAASRLDAATMRATIDTALAADGVVAAWDTVLRPVLAGVGERHARTGRFVEVEHLLSRCVSEALAAVPRPSGAKPARILLACAPEEQHSLALEALAAALAERGVPCRSLGARVPPRALLDAATRTGPAAVLVWSHAPDTAHPDLWAALLDLPRPPAVLAAAGPGWGGLPDGVARPATLADALAAVAGQP